MWAAPVRAELPTAKVAHEQAVSAVQNRDLERAKRGFLLAYIEAPRPILLYNLGVACRDLGQLEEARRYFRRYLSDPQTALEDPTRVTAEEELAKLNQTLPADETPQQAEVTTPGPEAVCPASPPALPPPPCNSAPEVDVSAARWRGAALATGSLGILSVGAGAALFVFSRGENPELPDTFEDGAWRQRSSDLQTGGIVTMAVGGVLTLAGVATWFLVGDETKVTVGLGNVALKTNF
jgi:hypothetical protein